MQHVCKRILPFFGRNTRSSFRCYSSVDVEVRDHITKAITKNQPVIALESTIITHGMPFPQNLRTALSVENILQRRGVVPATIGIVHGKLIVGLSDKEMEYLAQTDDCIKASRRDLSYVLSKKTNGGTTVSATMFAAEIAKIPIFVTGGIGGVHREAEKTFDISADLTELGKTPVTVICAGVKSILDIPLTLEYLETQGVPVISYSKSTDFPSFFSSKSGYKAPYNLENPSEVASLIYNQKNVLDLKSGVVVAVPIPSAFSADNDEIEAVIQQSLEQAKEQGIQGKEITPFVLESVSQISKGESLEANIKLIENNASVGADIALEYCKLLNNAQQLSHTHQDHPMLQSSSNIDELLSDQRNVTEKTSSEYSPRNGTFSGTKRPVVIGSAVLDLKTTIEEERSNVAEATNCGSVNISVGGVGRNIAEFLARCDMDPLFITKLGRDMQGEIVQNEMKNLNMDTSGVYWSRVYKTATYNVVTSEATGELLLAVGDMKINDSLSTSLITSWEKEIRNASIVVLDANLPKENLHTAIEICQRYKVPVWYEPTCFTKSPRPFMGGITPNIDFASPNFVELNAMHHALKGGQISDLEMEENLSTSDILKKSIELSKDFRSYIPNLLVTLGKDGLLLVSSRRARFGEGENQSVAYLHYPAVPGHLAPVEVKNVSGAGDSLAGGILYGYLNGYDKDTCIKAGLLGAYKSLKATSAISDEIEPSLLTYEAVQKWANFNPRSLFDSS